MKSLSLAFFLVACLPAAAQGALRAADLGIDMDCTVLATVQQATCRVGNVLQCADMAPRDRRVAFHDAKSLARIVDRKDGTFETGWTDLRTGERVTLHAHTTTNPAFDPSVPGDTEAVDIILSSSEYGRTHVEATQTVTGETGPGGTLVMAIEGGMDGPAMEKRGVPGGAMRVSGKSFYDPRIGAEVGSIVTLSADGRTRPPLDRSPVSIAYPGDPGYGARRPEHGCGG